MLLKIVKIYETLQDLYTFFATNDIVLIYSSYYIHGAVLLTLKFLFIVLRLVLVL